MKQSFKERWSYKGIDTALNGLTGWMYDNIELRGTSNAKYEEYCTMIVKYAVEHIPGFIKRGHARHQADYVAKKVQRNKMFQHFKDHVIKYKNQTP